MIFRASKQICAFSTAYKLFSSIGYDKPLSDVFRGRLFLLSEPRFIGLKDYHDYKKALQSILNRGNHK
ncbi:MAG TPA: hypothetical protein DCQ37_20620 [Desulfobacteraceae bacterium]|nr:hypothetical protein [Desulfobacteraceae bacterium]